MGGVFWVVIRGSTDELIRSSESSHSSAGFDCTLNENVPAISTGMVFLSMTVDTSLLDIWEPTAISTGEPFTDSSDSNICFDCVKDCKVTPDSCNASTCRSLLLAIRV